MTTTPTTSGMSKGEILRLVNDYIGCESGHIGDFSYATLQEFYPHYCGIDVDTESLQSSGLTKRKIFIHILEQATSREQARVIRGTLRRFPATGSETAANLGRAALAPEFERLADRLEGGAAVAGEALSIYSHTVERAIADAATLLNTSGATSGVDRVHTALHGYLMAICREESIAFEDRATLNDLLKRILAAHPAFQTNHPRIGDVRTIFKSIGSILDSLNPIRNRASVAHPNEHLLEEDEAVLVMDASRTVLNYLNRKLAVR